MFRRKKPDTPPHTSRKRKRVGGIGTMWVIAMLFIASGIVRLGDHGVAIAKEVSALASQASDAGASDQTCQTEEDITRVLEILQARENNLNSRESDLENRLQALAVAEAQIKKNMDALIAAEAALKSTMSLADGAAENDLDQLTEVYESMKPKQAIPLFAQMDPQFAAGFLGRMRSDAAAQILAGLTPEKSYAISVILASRNANVPTN
ncbi:MotE family protein [Aliiroseovarius crassostreae]|uniref:MotE family protein n=1 Tax=Aliiroseovarius crassostreae TaxID=154981 RepID=UPI003C798CC4